MTRRSSLRPRLLRGACALAFAFALGISLLIPLVLIALARVEEIASLAFGRRPRRLIEGPLPTPEGPVITNTRAATCVPDRPPAAGRDAGLTGVQPPCHRALRSWLPRQRSARDGR